MIGRHPYGLRPSSSPGAVRHALGLSEATALGVCISVGLGAYVIGEQILPMAGEDTPQAYVLAAIVFLPLLLSYAVFAAETPGNGSAYRIARSNSSMHVLFATGWVMLGGYVSLAALFLHAVVVVLQATLLRFGLEVGAPWLQAGVLVLAVANEITPRPQSRLRTSIVYVCLLATAGLVPWPEPTATPWTAPETVVPSHVHHLTAVGLLAAALWCVELVFEQRDHRVVANRKVASAVGGLWISVNLVGALLSVFALRSLDTSDGYALSAGLVAGANGTILSGVTLVLCLAGVTQLLTRGVRLSQSMTNDGFLPPWILGRDGVHARLLVLLSLFVGMVATVVPPFLLVGTAAATFLCTAVLVLSPYALEPVRQFSRHSGSSPLHAAMPGVAVGSGLFFAVVLPVTSLLVGASWALLGMLFYATYANRGGTVVLRSECLIGDAPAKPEKDGYRVLVDGTAGPALKSLIEAGVAITRAQGGELLVLRVTNVNEYVTREEVQDLAREEWRRLDHVVRSVVGKAVPARAIVRIAAARSSGILATAAEYCVDFTLLGWTATNKAGLGDPDVERVFQATMGPLAVLSGRGRRPIKNVLVATAGGPHSPVALQVGQALVPQDGIVKLMTVVRRPTGDARGNAALRQTLEQAKPSCDCEHSVAHADRPDEGILRAAEQHDMLLMGVSVDRLLQRALLWGSSANIARERSEPTLLVKAAESASIFWRRRAWDSVSGFLPPLSLSDRAQVMGAMRHSACAGVDFYVLIFLASVIAVFGLVQNSAAVVIGAMLVAPLMNPIIATAHGAVLGNLQMIRRACGSIVKGMAIAVGVGTAVGLPFRDAEVTNEILARTRPNLFDLVVALVAGATAAYAVSRRSSAAAMPGVAIAAALVPPLCVVGYGLGSSDFDVAGGALLLFMTNLSAIVLVGAIVFLLLGVRPTRGARRNHVSHAIRITIICFLCLTALLGFLSRHSIVRARQVSQAEAVFRAAVADEFRLHALRVSRQGDELIVDVMLYSSDQPAPGVLKKLRTKIAAVVDAPVRIRATLVAATFFEF